MPPKKWPSPEDLLRALTEAKQRFGCRELERLDAIAEADTGGQKTTDAMLAEVQANSKKREDPYDS
jgi:hypothetical protein